jgi:hypothetical protein
VWFNRANADVYSNPDQYADEHADQDSDANGHWPDADVYIDADQYPDSDADQYSNTDVYADAEHVPQCGGRLLPHR